MTSVSSSQPWGGHCSLLRMFPAPGTSVLPEQCAFSTVVFTAASKFSASFSWFTGSVATQSCAAQLSTAACASVDHGLAVLQSSPITERTAWGLQSISINCQGPKICCRASVDCSASKHVPFFFLPFFFADSVEEKRLRAHFCHPQRRDVADAAGRVRPKAPPNIQETVGFCFCHCMSYLLNCKHLRLGVDSIWMCYTVLNILLALI